MRLFSYCGLLWLSEWISRSSSQKDGVWIWVWPGLSVSGLYLKHKRINSVNKLDTDCSRQETVILCLTGTAEATQRNQQDFFVYTFTYSAATHMSPCHSLITTGAVYNFIIGWPIVAAAVRTNLRGIEWGAINLWDEFSQFFQRLS